MPVGEDHWQFGLMQHLDTRLVSLPSKDVLGLCSATGAGGTRGFGPFGETCGTVSGGPTVRAPLRPDALSRTK